MVKTFNEFNLTLDEGFWDWLTGKSEKGQEKTKTTSAKVGATDSTIEEYYSTLQEFADSGQAVEAQTFGNMKYSKMVEDIQIALTFLGYPLSKFGVDGFFGPETASAIVKFNQDTLPKIEESNHD